MTIIDFGRTEAATAERQELGLAGWCRKVLADAQDRRRKRAALVQLSD